MLRDTDAFDLGGTHAPLGAASPLEQRWEAPIVTVRADQQAVEPPAADARMVEQEIARLTWTVLDGGATLADRQRLAELVNAQHAQRRRFDR